MSAESPLTEHIGSLLRPAALLEARQRFADDEIDAEELRSFEDAAVLEALHKQEATGIDVLGDGEFRRTDFRAGLAKAVSGLQEDVYESKWGGGQTAVQARSWYVTKHIRRAQPIAVDEARFVLEKSKVPLKITLPAPGYLAARFGRDSSKSPYQSTAELADAFGDILRREIVELIELGVPYIQLDNPGYTTYVDASAREKIVAQGGDPDRDFAAMLEADISLLNSIPRGSATIGLHLCRGNNAGTWQHEGDYSLIAEQLFTSLPVDRLLLEYDDERSGGFEVLRFIPKHTVAVLGLISTKLAAVESPDALVRRLDQAAKFIDPSQLAISPQCGFATHAEGANPLSEDEQYQKLAVAVETARRWFA